MDIKFIDGKEWGMTPPKYGYSHQSSPHTIYIHHSGSSNQPNFPFFEERGVDVLNGIDRTHTVTNNWNAFGYHYAILPDGLIYNGRPDNVVGAHIRNKNTNTIGILVYGHFDFENPTDAQKLSLVKLIKYLKEKFPSIKYVKGHRDGVATSCPGTNLYAFIKDIENYKVIEEKPIKEKVVKFDVKALLDKISNLEKGFEELKKMIGEINA